MPDDSYVAWVNIFDSDVSKAYSGERRELQGCAMILCALQKEFERVRTSVQSQFDTLKRDVETHEKTSQEAEDSDSEKENTDFNITSTPDFFDELINNASGQKSSSSTTVVDLSLDDSSDGFVTSPTLGKKRSHRGVFGLGQRTPTKLINESTIIEDTPEVKCKRSKVVKKGKLFGAKRSLSLRKESPESGTSFGRSGKDDDTLPENASMDLTDILNYVDVHNKKESNISLNEATVEETYFDMDLTTNEEKNDDGGFTDITFSTQEEPKIEEKWACEECKRFYGGINLPPEKLKEKMGVCFRHKKKPRMPDTMPGFWDMTMKTQD